MTKVIITLHLGNRIYRRSYVLGNDKIKRLFSLCLIWYGEFQSDCTSIHKGRSKLFTEISAWTVLNLPFGSQSFEFIRE